MSSHLRLLKSLPIDLRTPGNWTLMARATEGGYSEAKGEEGDRTAV